MQPSRRDFLTAGIALPVAGLARAPEFTPQATGAAPPKPAPATLEHRTLGRTGIKVTTLGFGCMITSDPTVIERAADLGVTYFDTARGYQGGNNEKMVGAALKARRKDVAIATKSPAKTGEAALADLETSLRELGTDFVDVWLLHARSKAEDITDDLVAATQTAKKQGKARFVGVSTHSGHAAVFPAVIARATELDVILTSYNFTMEPAIEGLIDDAKKAGLGIVAMKVMAGGFRRVKPGDKLHDTLKRDGAMLAALKWAIRHPKVDTSIPSMTDMDQLDENLKAMAVPFAKDDETILAEQLERIRPMYCRTCGRCEGTCPEGLPVAEMLRFLSYADGYGEYRLARESFLTLPEEIRAVRCADCTTCAVQCTSGVRVSERLARAQELLA
jgi:uncharacterized protein